MNGEGGHILPNIGDRQSSCDTSEAGPTWGDRKNPDSDLPVCMAAESRLGDSLGRGNEVRYNVYVVWRDVPCRA